MTVMNSSEVMASFRCLNDDNTLIDVYINILSSVVSKIRNHDLMMVILICLLILQELYDTMFFIVDLHAVRKQGSSCPP